MKNYDHNKIEKKWQKEWEKKKIYQAKNFKGKKFYSLIEFPYPSGAGLHVGHIRSNTAIDIISRKKRMGGYNVLYPIGWDAFGLPTENYAIKTGISPEKVTKQNTDTFRKQLKALGFSFDWSREVNTTDPSYYKWTQWIFLQMFKKGLAYKQKTTINWCPSCKIGLANEEVVEGKCERCGTETTKKEKEQWMLAITKYADRLDKDLDDVDYLEKIKIQQRNWIGKSEGSEIKFKIHLPPAPSKGRGEEISNIVILHGRNGRPNNNFYPWLKKELENVGYQVYLPEMPNTKNPNDEEQANYLLKNVPINDKTVVITHSFGGVVAMRLLEKGIKVHRLIQFSTPITGKFLDGKVRQSITDAVSKGFDYEKIKKQAEFFNIIIDRDDNIVAPDNAEILAKNLGVKIQSIKARVAHFCAEEEPEMLNIILKDITYPQLLPKEGEFGYQTTDIDTWKILQDNVLKMRKNPTKAEDILWQSLRKNLTGYHFRRQQIVNKFIVDFICLSKRLIIEIDGDIHDLQKEKDAERTKILKVLGFNVIRFRNEEVIKNVNNVIERIKDELRKVLPFGEDLGEVNVFTTRADTLFGATYVVLAPEHSLVQELKGNIENWKEVEEYVNKIKNKTDIDRTAEGKEKTGIELKGIKAINPANNEEIPVWVADYVLASYGTGAVMAVPAHDERDYEFAKKYGLEIKEVVLGGDINKEAYLDDGKLLNSGKFDSMSSEEARKKITEFVGGKIVTKYKLRDWVFSRQRYWGEPIPLIYCSSCGWVPVSEKDLPVKLPKVKSYQPTDTGESPLSNINSWVNTKCPKCKGQAKRETDTMPNWAGSSWYYLRYTDAKNKKEFANKQLLKYWTPVDWYNGGMEHVTLHLLYSRFWHKFLYDLKLVPTKEPYKKRTTHGMILAEDGEKMSKSRGNVINPDELVKLYGADTLRIYEMFIGPFDQTVVWSTKSIIGSRRFLEKIWKIGQKIITNYELQITNKNFQTLLHKTIKKVSEDIESMNFNTAISSMMILVNEMEKYQISVKDFKIFLQILAPFAPHISEELWSDLTSDSDSGRSNSIHMSSWPKWDNKKVVDSEVKIVVQVNGKVRAELIISPDMDENEVKNIALSDKNVKTWLDGRDIKRVIYVPRRVINIVV